MAKRPKPWTKEERECIGCGKRFISRNSLNKYCTVKCGTTNYHLDWYDKNKDIIKDKYLKRNFNISLGDLNEILKKQDYKCRICKESFGLMNPKNIHVDHCHEKGNVRGVLCFHCNTGLGHFKDRIEILNEAKEYLKDA